MVEYAVTQGPAQRSTGQVEARHHPAKVEAYAKRNRVSLAEAERRLDALAGRESR